MPDYSYTSGKLNRSHLLTYIDSSFGGTTAWYLLGKDIEDASVELNADTEVKKNILDETTVQDNGYEPTMDLDTYYANPDDAIYSTIKDIAMNRKMGVRMMHGLRTLSSSRSHMADPRAALTYRLTSSLTVTESRAV